MCRVKFSPIKLQVTSIHMTKIINYLSSWVTDQDIAIDLQQFLNDKTQRWLDYFYKDITSEDRPYKLVPSLLPDQLVISLTLQRYMPRQETRSLNPPLVGFKCSYIGPHYKINSSQK